MKNISILLLCLFATAVFTGQTGPDMTGPPGECTGGQTDSGFTHSPDSYFPILYKFPPATALKTPAATSSLLFMSFNIQSDYDLFCREVLGNQTALVASINPDFLGLQETDIDVDIRCNCNQPQAFADAMGYNANFMQMFPWRTGKYGDTTTVGFAVEQLQYVFYNLVGAWAGSQYFERRGALAHLVSPPQLNGQLMWYINTHLEQSSLDARKIQVAQLINWTESELLVLQPNAVVVITGDFYTVPGDGSYEEMNAYFQNAWAVFSGSSNGGFTHPSDAPTLRYDHIWFREPAAGNIKVTVDDFTVVDSLLSDHRPIHATLSFDTSGTSNPSTSAPSTSSPTNPTSAPSTSNPTNPTSTPSTDAPTSVPTSAPGSGSTANSESTSAENHNWAIYYSGYDDNTCTSLDNSVSGEIFAYKCAAEKQLVKASGKIIYVDDVYLISCDYSDTNCTEQTVCATYNNSVCYASSTTQFSNQYSWTKDEWGRYTITYSSYHDQTCTASNDDLVGQIFLGMCATEYHSVSSSGMITYIDADYLTSCDYSDTNCQDPIICVNYTNSQCNSYSGSPAYSDKYSWALLKSSSPALVASSALLASALALAFL